MSKDNFAKNLLVCKLLDVYVDIVKVREKGEMHKNLEL